MKRLATILLAGTVAAAGLNTGPAPAAPTLPDNCSWVWKKKRVVKKVKRHGKVRKVVRIRKYRVKVCEPAPAPARIGVSSFEFYFVLSRRSLVPGDTIAELSNRGEDPHDLHISRIDGSEEVVLPETLPATVNRARFNTQPGTYRLWCSLPFHAERGMDTTFEVTEPAKRN